MQKIPLKMKMVMFGLMFIFMVVYGLLFGNQNVAIGMMIVMAAFMNAGNDMSLNAKRSFIKVLALLWILGIVSFLNNSISILGCILTFVVVFGTTFTSYNLFGTSVYLPYLMCYFMMMCIPVSIEQLPMRLLSLFVGAVFIVGLNLAVNRQKEHKLTKATITKLIQNINNAIDLKLNGQNVSKETFKSVDGFYLSLFSKFEYKYFPSKSQESILNVVKAIQYIGWIISECDLSQCELKYLKNILKDIKTIKPDEIFNGIDVETKYMNLVLLNLEIIVSEIQNYHSIEETAIPSKDSVKKLIKPVLKRVFSFKSPKFTFAFKMAFALTLWEVLTLMFNLPYTKWLYFATIPMMLPYINDFSDSAKSRVKGTFVGVFIFGLIVLTVPHIPLSLNILVMAIFVICMFGMIYNLGSIFQMTIFTTIISVMVSLMYISIPEAMTLKILWIVVAVIVISFVNFGFLPYSVEKETENNLKLLFKFNEQSINLIKSRCMDEETFNKTTLLVVSNLIRENIELTEDNMEILQIQGRICDICNFILNFMYLHEFSDNAKQKIIGIICAGEEVGGTSDIFEEVLFNSTAYVVDSFNQEKLLMENFNE